MTSFKRFVDKTVVKIMYLRDMTDDFQNASQSDEELANRDVEDSINPPRKRFKLTQTECDLHKIAQARTIDKQTVWGVKLLRGTILQFISNMI